MNDTQKAPLAGRPGRTLSRCVWLVLLVIVGIVMTACTSPKQKALAARLYTSANKLDETFFDMDMTLIRDIGPWNSATTEKFIDDATAMKRSWQVESESATGKVSVAAGKYTESIDLHVKAYEAANRLAQRGYTGYAREATSLMQASLDPAKEARDLLFSLTR